MRLLLVGAFPYPHFQGSQVYFQEQAIALRAAGADVELLTYATPGIGAAPGGRRDGKTAAPAQGPAPIAIDPDLWRALDGFVLHRSPLWSAPRSLRSGPGWGKPLGDLGLAMTLRDAVASRPSAKPFDAILTHNAEAAVVALATLPRPRPAIVYCVHTLLGHELSAYWRRPARAPSSRQDAPRGGMSDSSPTAGGLLRRGLDRLGRGIDRWIAARADGWIALTRSSECVMQRSSRSPGALIPPPVPDPMTHPEAGGADAVLHRYRLERGHYFLYSGNLDPYQELALLSAAVQRRNAQAGPAHAQSWPIVVASHARRVHSAFASQPGLVPCHVSDGVDMQALLSGALASLVTRRAPGGFPIKLVNSLAASTPVIAFHEDEWGLRHERNGLIGDLEAPVESLAAAIDRLTRDEDLAAQLSLGARALYQERHRPACVAQQTLALIEETLRDTRDRATSPTRTRSHSPEGARPADAPVNRGSRAADAGGRPPTGESRREVMGRSAEAV